MVSVATVSNEEIQTNQSMLETLKAQSEQIADNNTVVTEAMEQLQDKINKVASIANIVEELNANTKTVVNAVGISLNATDSQNQMISATADAFHELSGNMNILINNIQEIGKRIDHLSMGIIR